MALNGGTKLGPYEILSKLGAGGMGEVYRARDTRLERTVAIKVLPSHLSSDPDLKQRLEREARAISGLNHPHICTLYDIGSQDGVDFLIMEYLEGETISDRLIRGPLPVEQVLKVGTEIAEALEKAHRQGIVHRDLKPGNIMLTKLGVKLMDFGLAKPMPTLNLAAAASKAPLTPSSPTTPFANLTAKASPLTAAGTIVGTFQYMAPEQLEGKEADARCDIFAVGAVLYEMTTGRPAFEGKSQFSVLAAIMERDPEPIGALQPSSPPALERVIRACLAKDPEGRIQSAHDLKLQLQLVDEFVEPSATPSAAGRRVPLKAVAAALLVIAALVIWWMRRQQPPLPEAPLVQLSIALPADISLSPLSGPVISPDASTVALIARAQDGPDSLYLRRLDSPTIRRVEGTEMATYPFWSPDSASLGFFTGTQLKRVEVATGVVQVVAEVADGRGGAWSRDGVIIFCPRASAPLFRVSASGGKPQPLTELNGNQGHRWPSFLADGRHFVYTAQPGMASGGIFLASLEDPRGRQLSSDVINAQVVNDYLVFARATTLVAAKLDVKAGKLGPESTLVAERVRTLPDREFAEFSVAGNGALAYAPGDSNNMQLAWFDRKGHLLEHTNVSDIRGELDLSPDGRRLLTDYTSPDGSGSVEVIDLQRGSPIARALKPAESAVWSPTGESAVLSETDLVRKWMDGSEREEVVVKSQESLYADDWSKDGRWLLFERVYKQTNFDLMILDMATKGEPQPYLQTTANEAHGRISPDSRLLAYVSDESGRAEVYVQSFPKTGGGKWQISTQGGDQPYWRRDGNELYYIAPDLALMSVPIRRGNSFDPGVPVKLFQTRSIISGITGTRNTFVAAPDGNRFLIQYLPEQAGGTSIGVVLNWQQKLKASAVQQPNK
jgi:eukaryotic-like serine/threonine-protein kinase